MAIAAKKKPATVKKKNASNVKSTKNINGGFDIKNISSEQMLFFTLQEIKSSINKLDDKIDSNSKELNDKIDSNSKELNDKIDSNSKELNDKIDSNSKELNDKIDSNSKELNDKNRKARVRIKVNHRSKFLVDVGHYDY